MSEIVQNKNNCCGCSACRDICPAGAICMKQDEQGFLYPETDEAACIHCGKCRLVCTMVPHKDDEPSYTIRRKKPVYAFAARSADEENCRRSSSGGVFTVLAGKIIRDGGTVYGAVFDEHFAVKHARTDTEEGLEAMRTSKYVQSSTEGIFPLVISDLTEGRSVLFSGTPCQCASLTALCRAEKVPTDRLLTVDHICHGVPSPAIWKDWLEIVCRHCTAGDIGAVTEINMRSKDRGWEENHLSIEACVNGNTESLDSFTDRFSYRKLYSGTCITRPVCFSCPYASMERVSDLTLGDFWNYKKAGVEFDTAAGVNEILVNTARGEKAIVDVRPELLLQEVSLKDAWQMHLEYPVRKSPAYEKFWHDYAVTLNKEAVLRMYMKGSAASRIIHKALPLLQRTGLYEAAGRLYGKIFLRTRKAPEPDSE